MGSGHILVAAFDVLMDIYRTAGYTDRDAVPSIIGHNLYGLDIDDRAAQLAYFAVMMKACEYDHRYLSRSEMPQPHVCAIAESNVLSAFNSLQGQISLDALCVQTANDLIRTFYDAKEYGSILDVQIASLGSAEQLMEQLHAISQSNFELNGWLIRAEDLLPKLAMQAEIMQRKYDVVVTNPPYMGSGGMGVKLAEFVKDEYPDSKSDLFAVFIEKCGKMLSDRGYQAMITQHAWMFLSSFEKLRSKLQKRELVNMAHLGARAFEEIGGEVVQTTSFVMQKVHMQGFNGVYRRLIEPITQQGKEDMFLAGEGRFVACQDEFAKIPGAPVAYWAKEVLLDAFSQNNTLDHYGSAKVGISTANNERFVRLWHEVSSEAMTFPSKSIETLAKKKWFPFNNGGMTRRWYGNNFEVVNWENDGEEIIGTGKASIRNRSFYLRNGITWTDISTGNIGVRHFDYGYLFSTVGLCIFSNQNSFFLMSLLNSNVSIQYLRILCPTLHFNIGDIVKLPVQIKHTDEVVHIANENVQLSRADWDSFETSWDFKRHPLI